MNLSLTCPIYTVAAIHALEAVMKNLAATKKLQHNWVFEEVKTNLRFGEQNEVGLVIYPCLKNAKAGEVTPIKSKRIVLKPLPCGEKIKTTMLEIGFGSQMSRDPLLGTSDCPVAKFIGGDRKYIHDFFLIVDSLKDVLSSMNISASGTMQKIAAK